MAARHLSLLQLPALRMLLPMLAGILLQWYLPLPLLVLMVVFSVGSLLLAVWMLGPKKWRLRMPTVQGLLGIMALVAMGSLLVYVHNPLHQPRYLPAAIESKHAALQITLLEPLHEKPGSYKAEARIEAAIGPQGQRLPITAKLLIYFRKADGKPPLGYGTQILLKRPPERIRNAGNPGGFHYERHALMHGFTHQSFVGKADYTILPGSQAHWFKTGLFALREAVLTHIEKNIPGAQESAVAQALLIGYRTNLDDDLVQAYSNTGVVHIIAISGMHLAMLYGMLQWVLGLTGKRRWQAWLYPLLILLIIWAFTLLSGAAPSIVRSACMFTFLLCGQLLGRRSQQYNLLALSALVLLIYNPFSWWDVGFQLSYAAVLSILLFQRRISQWFYFRNHLLRAVWNLCSVTLAAQVLTLPLIMYHFHQFPLLFLFTNLMAVPLSGLALYALVLLLTLGWVPGLGWALGQICQGFIWWLNRFILSVNAVPGGVVNGIQYSLPQATLLCICFLMASIWVLQKRRWAGWAACALLLAFTALQMADYYERSRQRLVIIYNVPKATAIDVVAGFQYRFVGNDELRKDGFVRNFHLKPSRIMHRIHSVADTGGIYSSASGFSAFGKKFRLINKKISIYNSEVDSADLVLICQNPGLHLADLVRMVPSPVYVADGSNSRYKLNQWKREADSLGLPLHITTLQGAYVRRF